MRVRLAAAFFPAFLAMVLAGDSADKTFKVSELDVVAQPTMVGWETRVCKEIPARLKKLRYSSMQNIQRFVQKVRRQAGRFVRPGEEPDLEKPSSENLLQTGLGITKRACECFDPDFKHVAELKKCVQQRLKELARFFRGPNWGQEFHDLAGSIEKFIVEHTEPKNAQCSQEEIRSASNGKKRKRDGMVAPFRKKIKKMTQGFTKGAGYAGFGASEESGIERDDITLMSFAKCSHAEAVNALHANNNDISEAIGSLSRVKHAVVAERVEVRGSP